MNKGKIVFILIALCLSLCAFAFVACGETTPPTPPEPPAHEHTFATAWSSDGTNHWHASTCEHDVKSDEAAHSGNPCSVCGDSVGTKGLEYTVDSIGGYSATWIGADTEPHITIPSEYNGKPVTGIGTFVFYGRADIIGVTIPDTVTHIDSGAFSNCLSMTSIVIPDTVTYIGSYAFNFDDSLTIYCEAKEATVKWGLSWNSDCPVVWDCKNNDKDKDGYTYAIIDGIRYRLKNGEAFVARQPLNTSGDIIIPVIVTHNGDSYRVTKIEESAFEGCSSLTSVVISNGIKKIEKDAFSKCSALMKAEIPSSVTGITGYYKNLKYHCTIFEECPVLTVYCEAKNESYGGGWKSVYAKTVWDCKNNDLDEDGYFYIMDGGLRFAIKDGKAAVARQAQNLRGDIIIPESVTYKGTTYTVSSILRSAFYDCDTVTSVTIPDSVESIEDHAFCSCADLQKVHIPKSVTSMGIDVTSKNAVVYCEASTRPSGWNKDWTLSCPVVWDCDNNSKDQDVYAYDTVDGIFYKLSGGEATVIRQSAVLIHGDVGIPSTIVYEEESYTVKAIESSAFANCTGLKSISVPE